MSRLARLRRLKESQEEVEIVDGQLSGVVGTVVGDDDNGNVIVETETGETIHVDETNLLRLTEANDIDYSRYVRSHGKKPKNIRGMWAFYIDGELVFVPSSMVRDEAIKWAKEKAKEIGARTIALAESVEEEKLEESEKDLDAYFAVGNYSDGSGFYLDGYEDLGELKDEVKSYGKELDQKSIKLFKRTNDGKGKLVEQYLKESYVTTAVYDMAAEVYEALPYRDLTNKNKVKDALRKLGYQVKHTDDVYKEIQKNLKESRMTESYQQISSKEKRFLVRNHSGVKSLEARENVDLDDMFDENISFPAIVDLRGKTPKVWNLSNKDVEAIEKGKFFENAEEEDQDHEELFESSSNDIVKSLSNDDKKLIQFFGWDLGSYSAMMEDVIADGETLSVDEFGEGEVEIAMDEKEDIPQMIVIATRLMDNKQLLNKYPKTKKALSNFIKQNGLGSMLKESVKLEESNKNVVTEKEKQQDLIAAMDAAIEINKQKGFVMTITNPILAKYKVITAEWDSILIAFGFNPIVDARFGKLRELENQLKKTTNIRLIEELKKMSPERLLENDKFMESIGGGISVKANDRVKARSPQDNKMKDVVVIEDSYEEDGEIIANVKINGKVWSMSWDNKDGIWVLSDN
jgi:hypothetical protein